jgi:hypothetical protein
MSRGTGGAVWIDGIYSSAPGLVANNLFVANEAVVGGGVDHTLYNGVIWGNNLFANSGGDLYNGGFSLASTEGNTYVSPMFRAPSMGNYHLAQDSPLIDGADPSVAPLSDVDGFARPFDGDGDQVAIADVGAFEYPSGEIYSLVFLNDDDLSWDVRAGEERFNVYRGNFLWLPIEGYQQDPNRATADQFCGVRIDEMPLADAYLPSPGNLVYYLVTLTNSRKSYEGTLGDASDGSIRTGAFPCK